MLTAAPELKKAVVLSLTPSSIREYIKCPQLFKLKNLDRIARARHSTSPALSFGISLHAALEEIYKPSTNLEQPIDVEMVLRKHWNRDGYIDRQESESYFVRGLEALRKYVKGANLADRLIIGTEVFISRVVRLGGSRVRLGCKIDCVELRQDDVLELLDYKTCASGRVPTKESLVCDLPTFIYYLLARIVYTNYPRVVVSQINLHTLAKVEVEYEDADLAANKRALIDVVREIEASSFTPRPDSACVWCPVMDTCPAFGSEVNIDDLL